MLRSISLLDINQYIQSIILIDSGMIYQMHFEKRLFQSHDKIFQLNFCQIYVSIASFEHQTLMHKTAYLPISKEVELLMHDDVSQK